MQDPSPEHPTPAQLAAFLDGRLSEAERLDVETHVDQCGECCDALARVPLDPLSSRLRDVDDESQGSDDWSIVTDPGLGKPARPSSPDFSASLAALQNHPRYRLLEPLGKGGMGIVYRAQHRMMDRIVALKVIDGRLIDNPQMIERFRNEVKAAALLTHANIVRAYDAEQAGDLHFLVMEYVDGISLADLIHRNGPLPVDQALAVVRKVAHGLQHAYQHGMVHRDIKPQNIMVTRTGKVRILDFGLARFAREHEQTTRPPVDSNQPHPESSSDSLTMVGSILGTPDYIAPEQVTDARAADTRADIYSLGCTCYFLLTGHPPFPKGNALQKLVAHRDQTATPLKQLVADIRQEIADIVTRMMARAPEDRFQTPLDVAVAIDSLQPLSSQANSSLEDGETPRTESMPQQAIDETLQAAVVPTDFPDPINLKTSQRFGTHRRRRTSGVIAFVTIAGALLLSLAVFFAVRKDDAEEDLSQTSNSSVASAIADDDDHWTDVIPLLDPSRDAIAGLWQKSNGQIVVNSAVSARIVLPVEVPDEYDLEVEFTRNDGNHSIAVIFLMNGHQATFDIDAWGQHVGGIQNVAGKSVQLEDPNPTVVRDLPLANGERYVAAVRVRQNQTEALLNGQVVSTYRGNGQNLSLIPEWELPNHPQSIAIGAYSSVTTFHRIRLRTVDASE